MKIFLLCGSIAQKAHTNALLHHLAGLLKEKGNETVIWDLKAQPLPIALPEYHKDPTVHPDPIVRKFVDEVEKTDAVILGSPLYHGSYSGVLKNALDNLRGDAFHRKWVGLVGNASGVRASHVEFSHLRQVVNTMEGYGLQTQIGTAKTDYDEMPDAYVLKDEDIKKRCARLVEELLIGNPT